MRCLILYLLFIVCHSYAQTIKPIESQANYSLTESNGKYFKDINGVYNKFLGTWKYQNTTINPTEILEVVFYKQEQYPVSNYFEDRIYARFRYTKNGIVVFNNLADTDESANFQIFGGFFVNPLDTNKVSLSYFEPDEERRTRKSRLYIEFQAGNPSHLLWHLDWHIVEPNITAPKMPTDITLTKQP